MSPEIHRALGLTDSPVPGDDEKFRTAVEEIRREYSRIRGKIEALDPTPKHSVEYTQLVLDKLYLQIVDMRDAAKAARRATWGAGIESHRHFGREQALSQILALIEDLRGNEGI